MIIRRSKPSDDHSPSPRGEGWDEGGFFPAEGRGSFSSVHGEGESFETEGQAVHGEGESFKKEGCAVHCENSPKCISRIEPLNRYDRPS
jgi:hypothetical protein